MSPELADALRRLTVAFEEEKAADQRYEEAKKESLAAANRRAAILAEIATLTGVKACETRYFRVDEDVFCVYGWPLNHGLSMGISVTRLVIEQ